MRRLVEMRAYTCLALALTAASAPSWACSGDAAPARAVAEGIIAADNERDIGRVLGYYALDAILMPPNEAPVTDRNEIRERYEGLFADFAPQIDGRIDEICVEGNLAVVRGHNGGWLVSRVGGRSRELDDVYLMVLQRAAGGDWKISRLMWHAVHGPPR
jgi:ketosteroid isomerase-like protein